nr:NADH dehydrogenase subunit 6 [Actinocyclus sp. mgcode 4]
MIFFENLIFLILTIFLITSSILSISSRNIIHSIFYLILSFLSAVFIFFLLDCEFIAFVFLLIYVGAIAILFLFSVMLLNIKIVNSIKNLVWFYPIGSFFGLILFLELYVNFILKFSFKSDSSIFNGNNSFFFDSSEFYYNWFETIESCFNVEIFGLVLYSYFFIHLLIVGFILLLAILGTVVLTFDKTTLKQQERNQFLFKQIVRNV